ncbi:MAG: glutathione S-transferase [Parvibaculum sp.]
MTDKRTIFYSFRRCPYAMRARLALEVSGQAVRLREVVLRDKPDEMLTVSPKGTVPVLQTAEGVIVEESLDIMYWALRENDPENWLAEEAQSAALIADIDGPFKHHLDRYKYENRYDGDVSATHRAAAQPYLMALNERLAKSPWLLGERAHLADYAILPFVRQFANTDRGWFDAQDWPHLKAWLDRFLSSGRFQRVMGKYAQWKTGEPEVDFPVKGAK